ncbi:hypothetical protein NQ314_011500 [Rhamnusium bicolor]|uniref:PiggyBac transposable element-derived protein domain-containing protein n=1 Tax=Rhamnusium bicolor TaxID=1586634 RepID=A0AAV8XIX7_9CUCU|nr:hypothetical protein NQ314_011500 [Rhamnusium bicolor]
MGKRHTKEITSKKLKRGDIIALENNEGVNILKWVDKRPVMMLTTCKNHLCKIIETGKNNRKGEQIKKPDAVICYNLGKKGVDMLDQMASYYTTLRKTIKWYKKATMEILFGTMLVNAWVVQNKFANTNRLSILQFREKIIFSLLYEDTPPIITKTPGRIDTLGTYEGQARQVRKRCRECYRKILEKEGKKEADRKAKKVKTFCHDCKDKPTLCLECFIVIHSKQK